MEQNPSPAGGPQRTLRRLPHHQTGTRLRPAVPLRPQQTFANALQMKHSTSLRARPWIARPLSKRRRIRRNALPTGLVPRLLNRDAAAAYCGISTAHFLAHLSPHVPPILIGRKRVWDVSAIDRWLDQRSGTGQGTFSPEQWLERLDGDPGARR
jgi:predicted DNA-binding transcriptional regulator AlpA